MHSSESCAYIAINWQWHPLVQRLNLLSSVYFCNLFFTTHSISAVTNPSTQGNLIDYNLSPHPSFLKLCVLNRERRRDKRVLIQFANTPRAQSPWTVATGLCLYVFGSRSTNMVPGGVWVLHNLSPIVLLTESTPGTGHKYVVTQSCLVNHPPCLSYVSPSYSTSWEVDLEESSTESGTDMSEGSYFK